MRLRRRVGTNAIKMHDKGGRVLRVETTLNNPGGPKVHGTKEGDPDGSCS
jgi:hypothetical protein